MSRTLSIIIFVLVLLAISAAIVAYSGVASDVAGIGRITMASSIVTAAVLVVAGMVGNRRRDHAARS